MWQAVHEFSRYFGEEDGESGLYLRAKKALRDATFVQYKENLRSAVAERNQDKLEHVLYEVSMETNKLVDSNVLTGARLYIGIIWEVKEKESHKRLCIVFKAGN